LGVAFHTSVFASPFTVCPEIVRSKMPCSVLAVFNLFAIVFNICCPCPTFGVGEGVGVGFVCTVGVLPPQLVNNSKATSRSAGASMKFLKRERIMGGSL
jgi:hypothetical protein